MEAQGYSKQVEALRCCIPNPPETCKGCAYDARGECNVPKMMVDAADAIEALQAEVPKFGGWQKAKPKGVVTYSDGYAECSHCHETIWLGWWMNFCPHCGTQNRIIDPDDYDGAKMEVWDEN